MEGIKSEARKSLRLCASLLLFGGLLAFPPSVTALHVVPGSNCTAACTQYKNTSNTTIGDIKCYDKDYNDTDVGKTFQHCVSCEMNSHTFAHDSAQTDLGWALYNLKYAVDTCVYDFPLSDNQGTAKPCQQSCANITMALETNIAESNASTPYDYCLPGFISAVGPCASCYSVVPNQIYISNFLNALKVACITKPTTTTPFTVSPSDVFTLDPPETFPTTLAIAGAGSQLPRGAVVAIGICVPVFFFLVMTFLFLYCYLKIQNRTSAKKRARRSRRYNEKSVLEPQHGWHHESTARIRPVSYVAPLRTRYSNPLAQIAEDPSRSGSQSEATAQIRRPSKPEPPPKGLTTWERRGLEEASEKDARLSASMTNPTHPSGSTTIVPSDGRRDSGNSGNNDEDEQERQRSVISLTPPPLFSIPEGGSSSAFVPARSGSPWGIPAEPTRSTSRHSRKSQELERSASRRSQRPAEAERSQSRASHRSHRSISQELERSLSRMSERSQEPRRSMSRRSEAAMSLEPMSSTVRSQERRRSTSRRSDAAISPEPLSPTSPELKHSDELVASETTAAPVNGIKDMPNAQELEASQESSTRRPPSSIFREVSYAEKPND